MKKLFTLCVIIVMTISIAAQSPQRMSYQAVVRNTSGVLQANQAVGMKISILQGSSTGTPVYVETQTTTTNANGLVTIEIGGGTVVTGTFAGIDWSNGTYFIKTETDPTGGTNYTVAGTSQILGVPYALYAKTAKTANYNDLTNKPTTLSGYGITDAVTKAGTQTITGTTTFKGTTPNMEEALFDVKNKDGQTIFAVYNEGVRIWVADGAKGTKGGFAVGGFDMIQNYLNINADSARIYVKNPAKGVTGGFAVGGFDNTGGTATSFTSLTPKNYFIGHEGGQNLTTGAFNSVLGYQSGKFITTGQGNAFLGYQAGFANTSGTANLFLGYQSGYSNTSGSDNTFLGYGTGYSNTTGFGNLFIGENSGRLNSTGNYNTFIGYSTGINTNAGSENTFIGYLAGNSNTIGYGNNFLGRYAGTNNINGYDNTFIGNEAGYSNNSGYSNLFLGTQTGHSTNTGSRNLFLGNYSGWTNTTGSDNLFVGLSSGNKNTVASNNTYLGNDAGYSNIDGNNNTYVGKGSGFANLSGSGNVIIGNYAGCHETGSNKLFIDNQGRANESDARVKSLIYGIFDGDPANQILTINGKVGIGTTAPGQKLDIIAGNGRVQTGYSWLTNSDVRFKKNIYTLADCIEKVMAMRGVSFDLISDSLNIRTDRKNIGFIAQELENVIPEVVVTGSDGFKSVAYDKITAVLTEAIKEQQKQIESYKSENDILKFHLQSLQEEVEQIKAMLVKGGEN